MNVPVVGRLGARAGSQNPCEASKSGDAPDYCTYRTRNGGDAVERGQIVLCRTHISLPKAGW